MAVRSASLLRRVWFFKPGAQWHMLPQCYPNYKTVHRRFQTWCGNEIPRQVLTDIANELCERGVLDEDHRRDFCDGQERRRRDRCDEARKRPENHGNCGSPLLAALTKSVHSAGPLPSLDRACRTLHLNFRYGGRHL
jgi:transposase